MAQCVAGSHTATTPFGPDAMRLFFYKLCSLIRYSVTWIFVFDGPFRPQMKRGVTVVQKVPQWTGPCKQLLTAFGLVIHEVSSPEFQNGGILIHVYRHLVRPKQSWAT